MASRNGGEDSDESGTGAGDFRDDVGPAEPPPVTEAMITPRTVPTSPLPPDGGEPHVCHVCGEINHADATYCLACGVRLAEPEVMEPLPWVDSPDTPEDGPLPFDAGEGLLDLGDMAGVTSLRDREQARAAAEAEAKSDQATPPEPRVTPRQVIVGLVTLAVLFILFTTFFGGEDEPVESTVALIAVARSALDAYASSVASVADKVGELQRDAATINASWDERSVEYQETLTALSAIEAQATVLPDLLGDLELPTAIDAPTHQRLVASSTTFSGAAAEMVEGLEAPDTGEARQAALVKFNAAAVEFASLSRFVAQIIDDLKDLESSD